MAVCCLHLFLEKLLNDEASETKRHVSSLQVYAAPDLSPWSRAAAHLSSSTRAPATTAKVTIAGDGHVWHRAPGARRHGMRSVSEAPGPVLWNNFGPFGCRWKRFVSRTVAGLDALTCWGGYWTEVSTHWGRCAERLLLHVFWHFCRAPWHSGPQTLNVCISFGPAILWLQVLLNNYEPFIKGADRILVDVLNNSKI